MATLTFGTPKLDFLLSEADSARSRENYLLPRGKTLAAGEVVRVEPAVDLTTTAHTHTNTVLDVLAAATGLIVGDVYNVTGTGIPTGTTFTYNDSSAGTLSQAATATATIADARFTRPEGIGRWLVLGDTPAGISVYDVDATSGPITALVIARAAAVYLTRLTYPNPDDDDAVSAVISALAGIGIICRF